MKSNLSWLISVVAFLGPLAPGFANENRSEYPEHLKKFYNVYHFSCHSADPTKGPVFTANGDISVKWHTYHTGAIGAQGKATVIVSDKFGERELTFATNVHRENISWMQALTFFIDSTGKPLQKQDDLSITISFGGTRSSSTSTFKPIYQTNVRYLQTKPLREQPLECNVEPEFNSEVLRRNFTYKPPRRYP